MKNIYILLIAFLSFSLFPYSCEEEYIEGIGWKKIVYQDSGPVESLGRCPSSDTEATAVIVLGLLFWGAYEYFDAEPKVRFCIKVFISTPKPVSYTHLTLPTKA